MQLVLVVLFGWLVGALVNYLSDVLPVYRKFIRPVCLNCQARVGIWNYLIWPRRCTQCNQSRSLRVWLVEIIFIAIGIWLWQTPDPGLADWMSILLIAYLGVVTVIDIEHRLILHSVSLFGAILAVLVGTWLHGLKSTLIGGLAGFGIMLGVYFLGILFLRLSERMRGKPIGEDEAMGFGDVNLSGVIGLVLGWPGIVAGLVLAIILAGAVSLVYLVVFLLLRKKYRPSLAVPYGPFLVASTVILLYFKGMIWG
jgi:leader peptidase (prepilin peptidase) / N-methyltransferase